MKSLENLIPQNIAEVIGSTFMHSLWQLSALALLLLIVLAIVPQRASKLRYWLAVSTMGLMLVAPIATFGYLYEPAMDTVPSAVAIDSPANFNTFTNVTFAPQIETKALTLPEQVNGFFQENSYLLLGIWLLGVLSLSVRFLGSCWHVHRLRKTGTQDVPQELVARFVDLLDQVGIRRQVGIRYSALVDTPMVIGALKPLVLLPMGLLSGLSMEQVECILIHELGHVRRWDYFLNLVQSIAEIILFYHPATWFVTRVIRTERENCCDELVVQLKANKVQYARALLNLEVMRQQPTLAMASQGGDLASRIRRITGAVNPPSRKLHARGVLFGLVTIACVVLLATQSHTMVKAALPYFVDQDVEAVDDTAPVVPQDNASASVRTSPASIAANITNSPMFTSIRLASLLGDFSFTSVVQDSPITKVIMNNNGEEVELHFNGSGQVVSGNRNGVEIPQNELGTYQNMANNFFRNATTPVDAVPPLPPMGPMPPMPPLPPMGAISPMPPLPPMNGIGSKDFDEKAFEKAMEAYGKEMEKWGEQFGKQFDGQDWEAYGKEMEKWGEEFAKSFDTEVWSKMGMDAEELAKGIADVNNSPEFRKMEAELERLHEKLDNAKGKREKEDLESQIEELGERMSELQETAIERNMSRYEERMEQWAERQAEMEERMAEMEEIRAAEMEARAEDERVRMEEFADREAERANRIAEEADREAERAEKAAATLGNTLVQDGLIKNSDSYKIKLNESEFYVDGKKQSDELLRKYRALVGEMLNVKVDDEWIVIQHNSR